jgi:hypothetical protein
MITKIGYSFSRRGPFGLNGIHRGSMARTPSAILARHMALAWLNKNRRAANIEPLTYITTGWWEEHGEKWMKKARAKLDEGVA